MDGTVTTRPLVYIAGPYTRGDPVLNTREAVKWGERVEARGCDVFIPHLSLLWHAISPAPLERWYERDLAVLARCDAVVRFPGESTGADKETAFAEERGIRVFLVEEDHSMESLHGWVRRWVTP